MSLVEFHIIQSFPVSCLNRDDVGSPKTAIVGGVQRARVSSQCWKRAVRMELHRQGMHLGMRTKKLKDELLTKMQEKEIPADQAEKCAEAIAKAMAADTLLFFTDSEVAKLVDYAEEKEFQVEKINDKELQKLGKKFNSEPLEGLDIALFGRMVAKATSMNVEAAASFSHAISTHASFPEMDFFTAVDDRKEAVSAHLGSLEFNSATYYRYISLNVDQFKETLGITSTEDLRIGVSAFIRALFVAVPSARQSTMAANSIWDFARIYIRDGQRLQCAFDRPVRATTNSGYSEPSIQALKAQLDRKEKQIGSLFGKRAMIEFGEDETSIDDVIDCVMLSLEA